MARVTVEDCVERIPNRFDLVVLAGQRARDIATGSELMVDRDRDKNPVVALREIADANLDLIELFDAVVRARQKVAPIEENDDYADDNDIEAPEDDELDLSALAREAQEQGTPEPVNRDRLAEAYDAGQIDN